MAITAWEVINPGVVAGAPSPTPGTVVNGASSGTPAPTAGRIWPT